MSIIFMAAGIVGSIIAICLIIWKIFDSVKKDRRREESLKKRSALEDALKNTALSSRPEDTIVIEYQGKEFLFGNNKKITIGRGADNDIILTDGRISRLHCIITPLKNGMMISDNHSKNGTKINHGGELLSITAEGEKIESGDHIILGRTDLLFSIRQTLN